MAARVARRRIAAADDPGAPRRADRPAAAAGAGLARTRPPSKAISSTVARWRASRQVPKTASNVLLASLVRKDLVRPQKESIVGDEAYRFRHVLIRDAAYEGLPKATRASFHQAFVGWLDQQGQERAELDELAGYHLEQAARYKQELGDPDARAHNRGRTPARRSPSRAPLCSETGCAGISLAQRALSLDPNEPGLVELHAMLPWWLWNEGRPEDGVASVEFSLECARSRGDDDTELLLELMREQIVCVIEGRSSDRVDGARPASPRAFRGDAQRARTAPLVVGFAQQRHAGNALPRCSRGCRPCTRGCTPARCHACRA